ncbi:hypothetical protein ACWEVD_21285 [Nocardia thailandica]|uniref:Lipoprotein n=1 Tax=Nocardia thailandica TaxID=257275 RepID=A0ABW6PQ20_9NOCA|nr:hypothetical protein [Nocardia thailandica]
MTKMQIPAILLTLLTAPGCSSVHQPAAPPCSIAVFDLKARDGSGGSAEPLGSSAKLIDEFTKAVAQRTESVTMAEMTARAGWTGSWTHATYVGPRTTVEKLNQNLGTHLEESCITGFPSSSSDSDRAGYSYTLFFDAGVPIQAVLWTAAMPALVIGRPYVAPDTELQFTAGRMEPK